MASTCSRISTVLALALPPKVVRGRHREPHVHPSSFWAPPSLRSITPRALHFRCWCGPCLAEWFVAKRSCHRDSALTLLIRALALCLCYAGSPSRVSKSGRGPYSATMCDEHSSPRRALLSAFERLCYACRSTVRAASPFFSALMDEARRNRRTKFRGIFALDIQWSSASRLIVVFLNLCRRGPPHPGQPPNGLFGHHGHHGLTLRASTLNISLDSAADTWARQPILVPSKTGLRFSPAVLLSLPSTSSCLTTFVFNRMGGDIFAVTWIFPAAWTPFPTRCLGHRPTMRTEPVITNI